VVGAAGALSFVSFIGTLTLLPTLIAGALLWWRRSSRESAFGVWTGAGALLLYIAWLHRDGDIDPRPWLVLGALLFVAGIAGYVLRRR
jgi:hypothetical protein